MGFHSGLEICLSCQLRECVSPLARRRLLSPAAERQEAVGRFSLEAHQRISPSTLSPVVTDVSARSITIDPFGFKEPSEETDDPC